MPLAFSFSRMPSLSYEDPPMFCAHSHLLESRQLSVHEQQLIKSGFFFRASVCPGTGWVTYEKGRGSESSTSLKQGMSNCSLPKLISSHTISRAREFLGIESALGNFQFLRYAKSRNGWLLQTKQLQRPVHEILIRRISAFPKFWLIHIEQNLYLHKRQETNSFEDELFSSFLHLPHQMHPENLIFCEAEEVVFKQVTHTGAPLNTGWLCFAIFFESQTEQLLIFVFSKRP